MTKRVFFSVLSERNVPAESFHTLLHVAMDAGAMNFTNIPQGYMRTDLARNTLAAKFLTLTDNPDDTLIMLDNDHEHAPLTLERLADLDLPVVGVYAYSRGKPYMPCAFLADDKGAMHPAIDMRKGEVFRVDAIGHAALAIKRKVFVELQAAGKQFPWWRYEYTPFNAIKADGTWKGGLLPISPSEDMYFSRICREAGIPVYCDSSLQPPHLTTLVVDNGAFENYRAEHRDEMDALFSKQVEVVQ